MSASILSISKWSDLPEFLKAYYALLAEGDGIGRAFGYASLVVKHGDIKPPTSADVPNERARLYGQVVGMNVLAAGSDEGIGTRGTYKNKQGKEIPFHNVGIYAGLEVDPEGFAEGMLITVIPADVQAMLCGYIHRELGKLVFPRFTRQKLRSINELGGSYER
ncbi:MAG: hypothetical protein EBX50_19855, partial [Chitinophagia bacterium]|nr:hypothetical protein [Chitinophagia bacterium]